MWFRMVEGTVRKMLRLTRKVVTLMRKFCRVFVESTWRDRGAVGAFDTFPFLIGGAEPAGFLPNSSMTTQ